MTMTTKHNGAAASFLHAAPVARPQSSLMGRATTYSGIKPASGTAAELRAAHDRRELTHTTFRHSHSVLRPLPRPQTPAGGNKLRAIKMEIIDGLCTVAGFATLCALGAFILAL